MDQNELPLDQRHIEVPSGVPKKITMPVVHLVQTVHLSCTEANTISKRTETSFHLTNVSYKYHRVCLKRFPCLWYIRRKPCTYLCADTNTNINGPNELPLDQCHLEVPSGVPDKISMPVVHSAQVVHLSCS
jgi:hypothetical protein